MKIKREKSWNALHLLKRIKHHALTQVVGKNIQATKFWKLRSGMSISYWFIVESGLIEGCLHFLLLNVYNVASILANNRKKSNSLSRHRKYLTNTCVTLQFSCQLGDRSPLHFWVADNFSQLRLKIPLVKRKPTDKSTVTKQRVF